MWMQVITSWDHRDVGWISLKVSGNLARSESRRRERPPKQKVKEHLAAAWNEAKDGPLLHAPSPSAGGGAGELQRPLKVGRKP